MRQKVLYVFGGEKASGAEIVIDRLIRHNSAQVNAHLFIAPGAFADMLTAGNYYPVVKSNYLKKLNRADTGALKFLCRALINYLFLSIKVLKYIRRHKIAIVHANTVVPASYLIPAILFSKLFFLKTKWIWSDHDLAYFSRKDDLFASINVTLYASTLAVSEAVRNKYQKNKFFKKVFVLYNGLNTTLFKPDAVSRSNFRRLYNFDDDLVVFGIAANLSERKGQLALLRTFIKLKTSAENIVLILAGGIASEDSSYAENVIDLVLQNKNTANYIGKVIDMASFYNGCDIIISNSNIAGSEPLGTTIYEAMACEKIVIASDTGGTREIITNFEDGFLFVPENGEALAEAISYCINDVADLNVIKTNARKKVVGKFNIDGMAHEYNEILKTVNG